jgi:hypothetical protein
MKEIFMNKKGGRIAATGRDLSRLFTMRIKLLIMLEHNNENIVHSMGIKIPPGNILFGKINLSYLQS